MSSAVAAKVVTAPVSIVIRINRVRISSVPSNPVDDLRSCERGLETQTFKDSLGNPTNMIHERNRYEYVRECTPSKPDSRRGG
jgi:hypothetical protein